MEAPEYTLKVKQDLYKDIKQENVVLLNKNLSEFKLSIVFKTLTGG